MKRTGFERFLIPLALIAVPYTARAQEATEMIPIGEQVPHEADTSLISNVANVDFTDTHVEFSRTLRLPQRQDLVQGTHTETAADFDPNEIVVTAEAPVIVETVDPELVENDFNAGVVRLYDDYLSFRGDSTTWSVGDEGKFLQFEWRWGDRDGQREGYRDRTQTPIELEPDSWDRE